MSKAEANRNFWDLVPATLSSLFWSSPRDEKEASKMTENGCPIPNKSTLYTLVAQSKVEVVDDNASQEVVEETMPEENVSSLYKLISSQNIALKNPEQLEREEEYEEIKEIIKNQHFETDNRLSVAENSLYYVDDEVKAEQHVTQQKETKKSSVEILLRAPVKQRFSRSQSIVETSRLENDLFAMRKSSSACVSNEPGDLSTISFSFFNTPDKPESVYSVVEDSAAQSENTYSSPKNSVTSSRETSPEYVEREGQSNVELFYATCDVLQRRPPTPYGKRRGETIRESEYEDLDLEKEELPEIPTQCLHSEAEEYADVDANDYCRHREEHPKQRRSVRLVKMKSKFNKAWKSMKNWMNEEKEEGAVATEANQLVQDTDHVDGRASKDSTLSAASDLYVDMRGTVGAAAEGLEELISTLTLKRRRKDGLGMSPGMRRSRLFPEGQQGFEELRRYIKQGGDFCKELCNILQERSETESQYAKGLSKLSSKLLKTSKDAVGSVAEAWQRLGCEMEAESEVHRTLAVALLEEVVKPLKQHADQQHRLRKGVETAVDKTGKSLAEWRQAEAKSKKQSFVCARENEKLQDAMLDVRNHRNNSSNSASSLHLHHHKNLSEKESAKLELKRKKAEEAVKKSDIEYYTVCVKAERARLEWETAVTRGSHVFQSLEQDRLSCLKTLAGCYCRRVGEVPPKLVQMCERIREPVEGCDVERDIQTVISMKGTGSPLQEQLLPDFYAEHVTLAMNRERRRTALVKLLQLTRQDIERERRGKQGVENLRRAVLQTPNFGGEDTQQNVEDKLHHMKCMLVYLEATRYKISSALSDLDGHGPIASDDCSPPSHPLASHIQVTRDRQGLQQSVLRIPSWLSEDTPELSGREQGDGTSNQPDSDYDEFSSVGSEKDFQSSVYNVPIADCSESVGTVAGKGQCRALYEYSAKLYDELDLRIGDVINVHEKQADGWWLGELHGQVGIFPATYVEELE